MQTKEQVALRKEAYNSLEWCVVPLEDILSSEDFIILGNCVGESDSDWYHELVYPTSFFSELDFERLSAVRTSLANHLPVISHPNVYVCPLVREEMRTIKEIVGDKLRALNQNEEHKPKSRRKKAYKRHNKGSQENQEVFEDIQQLYFDQHKAASKSLFSSRDRETFEALEKIVRNVTQNTRVKGRLHAKYGTDFESRQGKDSHTEEQLVAVALYRCLIDASPSCIFTNDSDIFRVLLATQKHLLTYSAAHREIMHSFEENPIMTYFKCSGEIHMLADITTLSQKYRSALPEIPEEIAEQIGKEMAFLSEKIWGRYPHESLVQAS